MVNTKVKDCENGAAIQYRDMYMVVVVVVGGRGSGVVH